jgi:hypothetical protein
MKKSILILVLLSFCLVNGQTKKGGKLIGGSFSIYHDSSGDFDVYSLSPNYGKFINEDICIGVSIPAIYTSNSDYHVAISPFIRYFFGENDKTRFFSRLSLSYRASSNIESNYLNAGVGHVTFLNKNVGLEAILNYAVGEANDGLGFFMGFQIYL